MNETAPQNPVAEDPMARVHAAELLISNVLRIGTIASFCVVMLGMIVSFIHNPEYLHSPDQFKQLTSAGASFPHTFSALWAGLLQFHGQAIVEAGIVMLIATPVLRVAVSIGAFVLQKDRIFIIISSLVLILLIISFLLGGAG